MDKLEGTSTDYVRTFALSSTHSGRGLHLLLAKLNDLLLELESWFGHRRTSKRHLLSLTGKLSFGAKAVGTWRPSIPMSPHQLIYNSHPTPPPTPSPYYTTQPGSNRHSVEAPDHITLLQ